MKMALSPKQNKFAALGLLMATILIVIAAVATPLLVFHRYYDSAIDDISSRLGRYYKIASMRSELQKQITAIQARGTVGYYLKNPSPALAAAEIQELAKNMVEMNGGKLTSIQILPHKDDGHYRQVMVTIQLTGTLTATKKILYGLESSRPYLFVDNLLIRSPMAYMPRNAPNTDPDLIVQLDLAGYALKGAQ